MAWLAWLGKKKRKCVDDPEIMIQGCPKEYRQIYDSLIVCEYAQKPDYNGYRNTLNQVMTRKGYSDSTPLDWEPAGENAARAANVPNETMLRTEKPRKATSMWTC